MLPFSKESLLRCFLCQHPIQKYTNPAIVRSAAQNVSHDDPIIVSKNLLHGWPISETDIMSLHSWVEARNAQNTKTGITR